MQKGQIDRQWCALARAGVIGTIKCKKVKLIGSGTQWRALVHSGTRWGDWDN